MPEEKTAEEFYGEQPPAEQQQELATFSLGTEEYALPLEDIAEVLPVPAITPLPGAPPHVLGLANYRGTILPVIDLKKIFNLAEKNRRPQNRLIALQHREKLVGLLVDQVGRAISLPLSRIEPPLSTLSGPAAAFIRGEAQVEGKLFGVLKAAKLVEPQI